jgi:hypothetical protein
VDNIRVLGYAMGPFMDLLRLQVRSRCSSSSLSIKTYAEKIVGPFEFVNFLESEKYENRVFYHAEL